MTASPGMLALNERLGFQQGWAETRLVKDIEKDIEPAVFAIGADSK
jgi:hypothetical protein